MKKYCKYCHAEMGQNDKSCPNCGRKQGIGCIVPFGIVFFGFLFLLLSIARNGERKASEYTPSKRTSIVEKTTSSNEQKQDTLQSTQEPTEQATEPIKEIEIVSYNVTQRDEENILVVEYAWTNISDKAKSFVWSIDDKVFQNGIECKSTSFKIDEIDTSKQSSDVLPGYTNNIKVGYILEDMSPVRIMTSEMYGNVIVDETIDLSSGEISKAEPAPTGKVEETSVTITNHYITKDYEDKDVLVVEYDFYNGEDEACSFAITCVAKAFQSGIECNNMIFGVDEITDDAMLADIQPGVTAHIVQGYNLTDSSEVTIEVKSLFGDKTYLTENIGIS